MTVVAIMLAMGMAGTAVLFAANTRGIAHPIAAVITFDDIVTLSAFESELTRKPGDLSDVMEIIASAFKLTEK